MLPPRNTLDILVNEPKEISFGPYKIAVTPITIGELPAVLRHLGAVVLSLQVVATPEDAIALLGDCGDDVLAAVALAARLPLGQVQALAPADAAELLLELLEVNADFFDGRSQAIVARGRALAARLGAEAAAGAPISTGPTPSPA